MNWACPKQLVLHQNDLDGPKSFWTHRRTKHYKSTNSNSKTFSIYWVKYLWKSGFIVFGIGWIRWARKKYARQCDSLNHIVKLIVSSVFMMPILQEIAPQLLLFKSHLWGPPSRYLTIRGPTECQKICEEGVYIDLLCILFSFPFI